MSMHTPGPWIVPFSRFSEVRAENGAVIAVCRKLTGLVNLQANAKLIAASPDMFAALDEIGGLSRSLRYGGPDPMDLQELSDALEQAIDLAHAAIAKAKGVAA